jgi:DNA invertase Pin-like site-specific DNA recombinase
MHIGYARVSTLDQNLDLQLQTLRKAGCQKVFCEKVSGVGREAAKRRRIQFGRLKSSTTSTHNNGSSTRENPSEKSLTALTFTPQPSIGSERRWL